ncbi:MAG: SPOR domain-containing protein [Proteobacteria bacterium]|nr:SPOR domain-containing protein [Pseudomonadota bacterium]
MTKDYAKRRRNQHLSRGREMSTKKEAIPAWIWMSAGLLLGLCLSGALYWKLHRTQTPVTNAIVDIHEDNQPTQTKAKPAKKLKQLAHNHAQDPLPKSSSRFDFYTVLPSMNRKTHDDDPSLSSNPNLDLALQSKALEQAPQTALNDDEPLLEAQLEKIAKAPPTGNYFIQAGSFRRLEQAETLKAELAMSGYEASVQTFKMGNREYRYRVLIGPYTSKDQAQNQQMRLEQAMQLRSVVLKITV